MSEYAKIDGIMEKKYKPGDTVYLISSARFIEEATVVMTISGFVTIRFTQRGGGTRVRENVKKQKPRLGNNIVH